MSKELLISASILSADFAQLGNEIRKCEEAGVDMIHIDVMDGHFVPNITIGLCIVEAVRKITTLPIDTHLMIENPWEYVEKFADSGSDYISVHAECYGQRRKECRGYGEYPKEVDQIDMEKIRKDIIKIKNKNAKAFVVLNPGTPMCLTDLVDDMDGALMMSVNPGFAGQKFNPAALGKIAELRAIFDGDISIDGGINEQTAPEAVKAGANILATASYFFGADNPKQAVEYLKSLR